MPLYLGTREGLDRYYGAVITMNSRSLHVAAHSDTVHWGFGSCAFKLPTTQIVPEILTNRQSIYDLAWLVEFFVLLKFLQNQGFVGFLSGVVTEPGSSVVLPLLSPTMFLWGA